MKKFFYILSCIFDCLYLFAVFASSEETSKRSKDEYLAVEKVENSSMEWKNYRKTVVAAEEMKPIRTEEKNTFGLFAASDAEDDESEDQEDEEKECKKRKVEDLVVTKEDAREDKKQKVWERPMQEYEEASFLNAYAMDGEQGAKKESEKEPDPAEYQQYYDYYYKYYKEKYGVQEEQGSKQTSGEELRNQANNVKPKKTLAALVGYSDDSGDDE